jgi:hypothetical protein
MIVIWPGPGGRGRGLRKAVFTRELRKNCLGALQKLWSPQKTFGRKKTQIGLTKVLRQIGRKKPETGRTKIKSGGKKPKSG